MLAYPVPRSMTARDRVASATDGAAANRPAKLFGFKTSPRTANAETSVPPKTARTRISFIIPLPRITSRQLARVGCLGASLQKSFPQWRGASLLHRAVTNNIFQQRMATIRLSPYSSRPAEVVASRARSLQERQTPSSELRCSAAAPSITKRRVLRPFASHLLSCNKSIRGKGYVSLPGPRRPRGESAL
jgi:hypothetical protein